MGLTSGQRKRPLDKIRFLATRILSILLTAGELVTGTWLSIEYAVVQGPLAEIAAEAHVDFRSSLSERICSETALVNL